MIFEKILKKLKIRIKLNNFVASEASYTQHEACTESDKASSFPLLKEQCIGINCIVKVIGQCIFYF